MSSYDKTKTTKLKLYLSVIIYFLFYTEILDELPTEYTYCQALGTVRSVEQYFPREVNFTRRYMTLYKTEFSHCKAKMLC